MRQDGNRGSPFHDALKEAELREQLFSLEACFHTLPFSSIGGGI
jgi:hypothetical protein